MEHARLYPNLDRFYRLMRYALQEIMLDQGVWAGQDRVLCALDINRPVLQSELSRRLRMDPRALHRSIKYLQRQHYLETETLVGDRRANAILITSIGVRMVKHIHWAYEMVGKHVAAALTADDLAELNRLLQAGCLREDVVRQKGRDKVLADVFETNHF